MSDINHEIHAEKVREDILDELYELVPDFLDADTESIANGLWKHANEKYDDIELYVSKEDIVELVMEYGDNLR
tara:strand:+ start:51 stop:269 length:219 start_codon:yes stop_codon:yes gene_type:complete